MPRIEPEPELKLCASHDFRADWGKSGFMAGLATVRKIKDFLMYHIQQHKITRNRELRSCTECRRRKLKCDRQLPCSSCHRRHEGTSCIYTKDVGRSQSGHRQQSHAEARLEHLEQLVQELSRSQEIFANNSRLPHIAGGVEGDRNRIAYDSPHHGATHWSTMLEDIEELRTAIKEHDGLDGADVDVDDGGDNANSLLFGAIKPLSTHQILSSFLPLRQKADQLVNSYFGMKTVAAPFLHITQFSRLYRLFWDNPSAASPLWTSVLFSILHMATKTVSMAVESDSDEAIIANQFHTAAAHCLAIGRYHQPQPFVVEALVLYIQSICLTNDDISSDVAILMGTLIRLATVMGYHRDADKPPKRISAFNGEMRRRAWSFCMQLDMLISFQLGLPSNTQFPTWDTKPPTNLFDSDFDEDTVQLPPERPATEPTGLLFYIAKHKLMIAFEKVIRHTLSVTDRPDDEIDMIDQEIRSVFTALPASLQPRAMTNSVFDSPSVKITRLCVHSIYLKSLCVLHRKYITRGRHHSLQICHASAMDLVREYLDVFNEFEPGGQLETERWFMGSISWHDFLLGCMALCLTMCYTVQHPETVATAAIDIVESLNLLRCSKAVHDKKLARNKETSKVRRLHEATIEKFNSQGNGSALVAQLSLPGGQDENLELPWNSELYAQGNNEFLWSDAVTNPADDTEWAYMEQFLNLSSEDFVTGT